MIGGQPDEIICSPILNKNYCDSSLSINSRTKIIILISNWDDDKGLVQTDEKNVWKSDKSWEPEKNENFKIYIQNSKIEMA